MRKTEERTEGDYCYKIYKNDYDEFVVKFYFMGIIIQCADYYTDDERDARATAKKELFSLVAKSLGKGA